MGWAGDVSTGSWDRGDEEDEEWADAPADIGSFLHTRLRVDGDNSAGSIRPFFFFKIQSVSLFVDLFEKTFN